MQHSAQSLFTLARKSVKVVTRLCIRGLTVIPKSKIHELSTVGAGSDDILADTPSVQRIPVGFADDDLGPSDERHGRWSTDKKDAPPKEET